MALSATRLLGAAQQFKRYYVRQFSSLLESMGLTMREMDVVLFLTNNPACDTARDVTELRGIAKSQVSAAVELLAEKGLLRRVPDPSDRRVVHLVLTESGAALGREGQKIQGACRAELFSGLTEAETAQFQELLEKVLSSVEQRERKGVEA